MNSMWDSLTKKERDEFDRHAINSRPWAKRMRKATMEMEFKENKNETNCQSE